MEGRPSETTEVTIIVLDRTLDLPATPASVVFDFVADLRNLPDWDPSVLSVESLSEGEESVGSTFRVSSRLLFRRTEMVYRIAEIVPGERVVFTREGGSVHAVDTINVANGSRDARLTYEATLRLRGPMRLALPLLRGRFRRDAERAVDNLALAVLRLRPQGVRHGFHAITW
jgi:hypothetical protein